MIPQLAAVFLSFGGRVVAQNLLHDTVSSIASAGCASITGHAHASCIDFMTYEIETTISYECGNRTEAFVACLADPFGGGNPVTCESDAAVGTIDPNVVTCIGTGILDPAVITTCLLESSQVSTECIMDVYTAYDYDCGQQENYYQSYTNPPTGFVQCALYTLQRCGFDTGDGCYYGDCDGPGTAAASDCPVPVYPPVTATPSPTATSTSSLSPSTTETPLPTMTDTVSYCDSYANVPQDGMSCTTLENTYGISFAQLFAWNPSILSSCDNLELGFAYCVGVSQSSPPGPTQPNIIPQCNAYVLAIPGISTCAGIIADYGLTYAQFYAWNPDIQSDCSDLEGGDAYCVGLSEVTPPAPTSQCEISTCDAYYTAVEGDTCNGIYDSFEIEPADFFAWNPATGAECTNVLVGIAYCVGISGPAPTSTACASSSAATSTATTITTSSPTITIEPQPDIPYFAVQLTLDNAPYHVAGNGSIVTDLSDAGILYIEDGSLFNVDGGYVSADPFDDPVYVVLAETRNDYVFSTTFFLHEVNQNSGKIGGNGNDTQALKRQSGTESYILQWENEAFAEPDLLAIFCVSDGYVYAVLVNAPIPSSCVTVDLGIVEVGYVEPFEVTTSTPATLPSTKTHHHHGPHHTSYQGIPTPPPLNFCRPGEGLHLYTTTMWKEF